MPWRITALGSFLRSLELVGWRQPMASCKAHGPSGLSKPFGRALQCADGELGRAFMSTRPRSLVRYQSPEPGFGEKYWSLSAFPSHSFQSGGGAFLTVIFGQIFAYAAFSNSHFSSPGSVSAWMASTGHSGSQTPQSMHSPGWITSIFSPS